MKTVLKGDPILGFGLITNVHGRVTTVVAGTAAEKAGVQAYDKIVCVDGAPIDSESGALALLSSLARGDAELTIERPPELQRAAIAEKENKEGSSPFGSRAAARAPKGDSGRKAGNDAPAAAAAASSRVGDRTAVVNRAAGESWGVQYRMVACKRGQKQPATECMVTSVTLGGPADLAGLAPGDIIAQIDGKKLDCPLADHLARPNAKEATQFVLTVRRGAKGEEGAKTSLSDARVVSLSADI